MSRKTKRNQQPELDRQMAGLRQRFEQTAHELWPCMLCDQPTLGRGVWMPPPDVPGLQLGRPAPGKTRVMVVPYGICERHPTPFSQEEQQLIVDRLYALMLEKQAMEN